MPWQNVIDTAFKGVPPQFGGTERSHKYNWCREVNAPDPLARSLQLPSARARSVTIAVLSRDEVSKSTAALMLCAHWITIPCASMSRTRVASGLMLDTKITVPACLSVCIGSLTPPEFTLSCLAFDWP